MSSVLITGANRGIGLAFARSYAADGWDVIATSRRPGEAEELNRLDAEILPLDAADPASIAALAQRLADRPIDLVVANAGIYGSSELDADEWVHVLRVNSIGPALLAQALRVNVANSADKRMVAVTSGMGSIGESSGGHIPYRSSKAALNMAWKSLSIDYARDGIIMAVINPGWVKTDMGGVNAAITPEQSVEGMRRIIDTLSPAENGRFLSWDGREFPW